MAITTPLAACASLVESLSAACCLLIWHSSSGEQPCSCFVSTTTETDIHDRTFGQAISGAADRLFRLAIGVLPVLAVLVFGYTTYVSMKFGDDPLQGAFSLAVYAVFLLSTASIIFAHSLRNEQSEEKKKRSLYVVISLFCLIGVAFFARVSAILPRPAYCLLLAPWSLPVSAALAFYFIRRSILSSRA